MKQPQGCRTPFASSNEFCGQLQDLVLPKNPPEMCSVLMGGVMSHPTLLYPTPTYMKLAQPYMLVNWPSSGARRSSKWKQDRATFSLETRLARHPQSSRMFILTDATPLFKGVNTGCPK